MKSRLKVLLASLVLISGVFLGCGDSVKNDQGVSLTFIGWYADEEGDEGVSTAAVGLADTQFAGLSGFLLYGAFSNNLFGEAIRLQRIRHSYEIPGSNFKVPNTEFVVNGLIAPAPDNSSGTFSQNSTLPPSLAENEQIGQTFFAGVPVITPEIMSFLSFNRNSLPARPFQLVVTSHGMGVSTAGRTFTSNDLQFAIYITEENNILEDQEAGSAGTDEEVSSEEAEAGSETEEVTEEDSTSEEVQDEDPDSIDSN